MLQEQDDDDQILTIDVKKNLDSNDDKVKNRCFNIFPSLIRRQYSKYKSNCKLSSNKHYSFNSLNDNQMVPFPFTEKCLIPGSPISPRVKNFNLDMKILVLSRNDNPYLSKQIKRSNSLTSTDYDNQEYYFEQATPIFSRRCQNSGYPESDKNMYNSHILFQTDDDQKNLHEQLIRSPPPNFPEKLSHFLFNEDLVGGYFNYDDTGNN